MIVQPTFCPFLIRYIFVLFVIHLLHVRLLTTCLVRMRSLRLPRRSSPPLRRLPSLDKHFLHFFSPFGVRYLYPLICYSTITQKASGANFIKGLRRFCLKTQYEVRMLKIGFSSTVSELCEVLTFCRIFKSNV